MIKVFIASLCLFFNSILYSVDTVDQSSLTSIQRIILEAATDNLQDACKSICLLFRVHPAFCDAFKDAHFKHIFADTFLNLPFKMPITLQLIRQKRRMATLLDYQKLIQYYTKLDSDLAYALNFPLAGHVLLNNLDNGFRVECLIRLGANINTQNMYGRTALIEAVIQRQMWLVKFLLANNADSTLTDLQGNTALDIAYNQASSFVPILLSASK